MENHNKLPRLKMLCSMKTDCKREEIGRGGQQQIEIQKGHFG